MQRLELDCGILQRRHQVEGALFVLQEQVLGVAAWDLAAQRLRLLDREQGGVAHGPVGNTEPVEEREQVVWGGGHGGRGRAGWANWERANGEERRAIGG